MADMMQRVSMQPVWIASCFGWLHRSTGSEGSGGGGVAVLICPGFSRDRLDAHHSLRLLADALARGGYPVLRFDYPGTGDSGDVASDDPWQDWRHSVHAALDWLREATGAERLILCGLRLGAALAALAAAERGDVAALALLAPILRGRSYMQQLQMEARLQGHAAAAPGTGGGTGVEFHEVRLDAASLEQVARIDLRQIRLPHGIGVGLFMQAPSRLGDECAETWRAQGAHVVSIGFSGLEPLLRHNEETEGTPPDFAALLGWIGATAPPQPAATARVAGCRAEQAGPGWIEVAHRFGPDGGLFGMLCRPDRAPDRGPDRAPDGAGSGQDQDRAVIIVNSGRDPHYGVARFGVELARHLAGLGIATLRMDFAGLGDSIGPPGKADVLTAVFTTDRRHDIRAAVDLLAGLGYRRMALQGLCSGAYHALQAVLTEPRIGTLLLVNLPAFEWREGDSYDFVHRRTMSPGHYLQRLATRQGWRRLLSGQFAPGEIIRAQAIRISDRLRNYGQRLAERRGWVAPPSPGRRSVSALAARGVRALFLFAATDNGIDVMEQEFGAGAAGLRHFPHVAYHADAGFDHLLSTRAMRRAAIRIMTDFIKADASMTDPSMTGPLAGPPQPAPEIPGRAGDPQTQHGSHLAARHRLPEILNVP